MTPIKQNKKKKKKKRENQRKRRKKNLRDKPSENVEEKMTKNRIN